MRPSATSFLESRRGLGGPGHGGHGSRRHGRRSGRPGVALLVTLVVVMLITFFLSEFTFSTGLELRSLETYQATFQARSLARSAFTALESGLLVDEAIFMDYYRRLQPVLAVAPIPWEEGELVSLELQPLDPLFNLNAFHNQKPYTSKDLLLWTLFHNTMAEVVAGPGQYSLYPRTLDERALAAIYAALFDRVDDDDAIYNSGWAPAIGAEAADYFGADPPFQFENGQLDRLSEMRLVRGVAESGIAWEDWERRFTVVGPSTGNNNFPGLINPNVASRDEIVAFLRARSLPDPATAGTDLVEAQKAINDYADKAETIADNLIPQGSDRPVYDAKAISDVLKSVGVNEKYATQVFSPAYHAYRVRLVTEVDQVQARLEAEVTTDRNLATRTASQVRIRWLTLE